MRSLGLLAWCLAFTASAMEVEAPPEPSAAEESLPEREPYGPLAELESIRLEALGRLEADWLERMAHLRGAAAVADEPDDDPVRDPDDSEPLDPLPDGASGPNGGPGVRERDVHRPPSVVKAALMLVASSLDAENASAMARPSVSLWLSSTAELTSAVTLARMRGQTQVSFPEAAASIWAVMERTTLPGLALRASVIPPNSGATLAGEFGARTTKTFGATRLHGMATYFGQQVLPDRYALGVAADGAVGSRLLVRGNALFERWQDQTEGAVTGEGGLSVQLFRWLQLDGVLRMQRSAQMLTQQVLLGLSAR